MTVQESELKALNKQWMNYAAIYLKNINALPEAKVVLGELNDSLSVRTYLTGNNPMEADYVIFKALHSQMAKLTFLEKEEFLHLSRWYKHMQHLSNRSGDNFIVFSRSLLY